MCSYISEFASSEASRQHELHTVLISALDRLCIVDKIPYQLKTQRF